MIKNLLILILFFIFSKCVSNRCSGGEGYLRLKNIFKNEQETIQKPGEKQFKKKLTPKLCEIVNNHRKILFIEEIDMFNPNRKGLIYTYDNSTLHYFFNDKDRGIQLGAGDNNFVVLRKILERVRDNFEEANKLQQTFSKRILNDSPLLQIMLIDGNEPAKHLEFLYSPNSILNDNW